MNITIVGTDYVDLVSGICFAEMRAWETCTHVDASKIDKLKNGVMLSHVIMDGLNIWNREKLEELEYRI